MADLPNSLLKLITKLVQHQIKQRLGEGTTEIIVEGTTEFFGETVVENLKDFLDQGENARKLLVAFQDADSCFARKCGDDELVQAIHSKPLAALPKLEKLAIALPQTLDDDTLLEALHQQFVNDWSELLAPQQIDHAAVVYRDCLDHSLAIRCEQLLPTVFRKLDRIEYQGGRIERLAEALQVGQEKIIARLEETTSDLDIRPNKKTFKETSVGENTDLFMELRKILIQCEAFESNAQLKAVFRHPKLSPWRNSLIDGHNPAQRVDFVVDRLYDARRSDTGEYALVILLDILKDLAVQDSFLRMTLFELSAKLNIFLRNTNNH